MTTYPGGKGGAGVCQQIINQMPPHALYIEAFLGSGAVLRAKKPARSSIAIEIDADVITTFSGESGRVPGLTLICGDAIEWMEDAAANRYVSSDTLIYCDPPYVRSSRRSPRDLYKFEMTDKQHLELLNLLDSLDCLVIISGYYSDLYDQRLRGWRMHYFQTSTHGGTPATEFLWMNYPPPIELHDYRYLGNNFREREKLKRRKARWLARLQRMQPIERYAMLDAIESYRSQPSEVTIPTIADIAATSEPAPPPEAASVANTASSDEGRRQPSPELTTEN